MNTIKVRYFAALQEQAKLGEETMTTDLKTYSELYQSLVIRYGFSIPLNQIQVAVDNQFTSLSELITDQAQVVFIPPVSGG